MLSNTHSKNSAQNNSEVTDTNIRCLIVESNFLISLDLTELLQSLGFVHIDHASDENHLHALLQSASYQIAFIDLDQGEDVAHQMASQMRLKGADIIFTSTLLDQSDMQAKPGDFKLLSKPYSANALKDVLALS